MFLVSACLAGFNTRYVWVSGGKRAGKGVTTWLLEKSGIEVKTIDSL